MPRLRAGEGHSQEPILFVTHHLSLQETRPSHLGLKRIREKVCFAWVAMEKLLPISPALGGMEKDTGGQFPPKIIRPQITF